MRKYISYLLIFFLFCNADCRRFYDYRLKIKNTANYDIYYLESASFPDTINYSYEYCRSPSDFKVRINANQQNNVLIPGTIEQRFIANPQGTLMYFIYKSDSAQKYYSLPGLDPCDTLRKRPDLILKRFDVTLNYLETHDWTLVYP